MMLNWVSVSNESVKGLAAVTWLYTFFIEKAGRYTVLTIVDSLKKQSTIFELESVEEAKARAEKFLEDK